MFIKDLDFIIPHNTICDVTIRDHKWNIIKTVKRPFVRIPLEFRKCEIIRFFPSDDQLIIDCWTRSEFLDPLFDSINGRF